MLVLFHYFIISQSYRDKIYSYYVYLHNYALYVAIFVIQFFSDIFQLYYALIVFYKYLKSVRTLHDVDIYLLDEIMFLVMWVYLFVCLSFFLPNCLLANYSRCYEWIAMKL